MKTRNLVQTTVLCALGAAITAGAAADSLFSQRAARNVTTISEKLDRFEPGDIITVLIRETLDASTTADTNTKKESDVEATANAGDNQFLVGERPNGGSILNEHELPNWLVEAENETKNEGDTRRRNTLTTSITCTVQEVHKNGNLRIEGEKQVTVNREDSTIFVSGIIRDKDVTAQNTIQSTQVADAVVRVKGKGPLWNNQRRGLVTRFLDWFSPF